MKKALILSTILFLGTIPAQAYAATPTPAPAKTDEAVKQKLDSQINELKEKIASRVSELNLVEKRGMIGTVSEVKGTQITLTDSAGNTRFIDVDEITKFNSDGKKNFGLSDLTKGTKISALGIYNKQSKRLLARYVSTYASPTVYSGAVASIDAKNFRLTIATPDQKEVKVDVDTATKLSSYTMEDGLKKYGFSKIAVGDRVSFVGAASRDDATVIAASRLVDFIGIPKDPRVSIDTTTASAAASAATPTPATKTTR